MSSIGCSKGPLCASKLYTYALLICPKIFFSQYGTLPISNSISRKFFEGYFFAGNFSLEIFRRFFWFFWRILLTYNLLTIASFRIGVLSISLIHACTKYWFFTSFQDFGNKMYIRDARKGPSTRFWQISKLYFNREGGGDRLCPPNYYRPRSYLKTPNHFNFSSFSGDFCLTVFLDEN